MISVIIPTYGRQAMVERAVRSVVTADPTAEIIVVDDASPVPIEAPAEARLVRLAENQGVSGARNAGVAEASGEIIAFLDSDDVWHPDRIRKTLPHLDDAPIVLCWSAWMDEKHPRGRFLRGNISDTVADGTTPQVGATLLRRDAWEPFDVSYRTCEDIEWWIRISQRGHVRTVPKPLCLMESHDGERYLSGFEQRIRDSRRLLDTPYFKTHRKARAFRLRRIGVMSLSLGDRETSLDAFRMSLRSFPTTPALVGLTRSTLTRGYHRVR